MTGKYDDIIGLARPVSGRHAAMSGADRAAQFSAFAALTGFDAVIAEEGRLTESCAELTESAVAELDRQLRYLHAIQEQHPRLTVLYFCPDGRKQGGAVRTAAERLKKVDAQAGCLLLEDGTQIPFTRCLNISVLPEHVLA